MNRSQRRSRGAEPSRINAEPPRTTSEAMLQYLRSKPHMEFTCAEIATALKIQLPNARYHLKKHLDAGAVESGERFAHYRAKAGVQTLKETRAEIAKLPPRIVEGEPWSHGAQPVALVARPHYRYFERHLKSIRSRIATSMTVEDLEAFDELVTLSFPLADVSPKQPKQSDSN